MAKRGGVATRKDQRDTDFAFILQPVRHSDSFTRSIIFTV